MDPLAPLVAICKGLAMGWYLGKHEAEQRIKEIEVVGGGDDIREEVIDAVDNAPSIDD